METTFIHKENRLVDASEANLSGFKFHNVMINDWDLNNVAMRNCKIVNADLSNLEIEGSQIGGAYIHNIGGPPEGHPAYDPNFRQRPVKFEDCNVSCITIANCNLTGLVIDNCNLRDASITDTNLSGMTINGILVTDLLNTYGASQK